MTGLDQTIADHRAARADGRPASLAEALAALQRALPEVKKSETAEVPTKAGGMFRYTYAGLAAITAQIMPALGELGLSFSARPTVNERGQFVLAYELLHVCGEHREGEYPLSGSTPQQQGSAITYARRYSLLAVTGLAPDEDDDAAAAEAEAQSQRGTGQRQTRAQQHQRPPTGGTGQPVAQRATRARAVDGPPLPGEEPVTEPAAQRPDIRQASGPMLQKMAILFGEIGITERTERLALTSTLVGHPLNSGSDLTFAEGRQLIDRLTKAVKQPDPLGWLATVDDDTPEGDPS
jgi:hypothetical protein